MKSYILAIDQGTSSNRAHLFSSDAVLLQTAQIPLKSFYPHNGWVEQDPEEIWSTTLSCCAEVLKKSQLKADAIAVVGIANQRETTVLWNKNTGRTIYPAISWQDRRTADFCARLAQHPIAQKLHEKTGLLLDPYFSASKIRWILDEVPGARQLAEKGELLFGTIDCFLLWRLTKGKVHATDASNASRTLLFNIKTQVWDPEILAAFEIPPQMLPQVLDSSADFGKIEAEFLGAELKVGSLVGDQQAALVGQTCFKPGMAKATFGTGGFIMLNTGSELIESQQRLLSTVAYRLKGKTSYAVEGSIFSAGSIIQWLRDKLKLLETAAESERLAQSIDDTGGVYLLPAFVGLGAPYWRPEAKALLCGLSFGSGREQIVRAALEAVAYQSSDLLAAMISDHHLPLLSLRVDGGMTVNHWFLQFLADILQVKIARLTCTETTALGAAFLAGLQVGIYQSLDEISELWRLNKEFNPAMEESKRNHLMAGWKLALKKE